MKRDIDALIRQSIDMYRKGMSIYVIQNATNMKADKWRTLLTDEDKRIHDEHIKHSRRIYDNFMVNGRIR